MTPIFSHWQGELSEGIAQLFRGQINATSGEKRKSDEVVSFETASNEASWAASPQWNLNHKPRNGVAQAIDR